MIRQGAGELDLAEIAADAELLDLLAARAETTSDDPVARMLAAFAAEVDDGLAELLAHERRGRRPPPYPPCLSSRPCLRCRTAAATGCAPPRSPSSSARPCP